MDQNLLTTLMQLMESSPPTVLKSLFNTLGQYIKNGLFDCQLEDPNAINLRQALIDKGYLRSAIIRVTPD